MSSPEFSNVQVDDIIAALKSVQLVGDGANGDVLFLALEPRRTAAHLTRLKREGGSSLQTALEQVRATLAAKTSPISSEVQRDSIDTLRDLYELGPTPPTAHSSVNVHLIELDSRAEDYLQMGENLTHLAELASELGHYGLVGALREAVSKLEMAADKASLTSVSRLNSALRSAAALADPTDPFSAGVAAALACPPDQAKEHIRAAKVAAVVAPAAPEDQTQPAMRRVFIGKNGQTSPSGQARTATGRPYEVQGYEMSKGLDRENLPAP